MSFVLIGTREWLERRRNIELISRATQERCAFRLVLLQVFIFAFRRWKLFYRNWLTDRNFTCFARALYDNQHKTPWSFRPGSKKQAGESIDESIVAVFFFASTTDSLTRFSFVLDPSPTTETCFDTLLWRGTTQMWAIATKKWWKLCLPDRKDCTSIHARLGKSRQIARQEPLIFAFGTLLLASTRLASLLKNSVRRLAWMTAKKRLLTWCADLSAPPLLFFSLVDALVL